MLWSARASHKVVACLALVALGLGGTACGGDNDGTSASPPGDRTDSPAKTPKASEPATTDADEVGDADEVAGGDSGDCSFVDVAMVDNAFGSEPGFEAQVDPSPLLPAEGAVTCGFDESNGDSTVTVVRLENAPHHYESYESVIKKEKATAPFANDLDGIGDRAIGGVVEDIAAQVAFEVGSDYMLVVGVSSARDTKLYEHCKALAAALAG
jgi:hypothetical protein